MKHKKQYRDPVADRDSVPEKASPLAGTASEQACTIFDSLPLPSYAWRAADDSGTDFILIDFNHAADEDTGGRVRNIMGALASQMYADDPEVFAEIQRCFRTHQTTKWEFEYRFRSTGKTRLIEATLMYVPPDLIFIMTDDVTDRRHAEQERTRLIRNLEEAQRVANVGSWEWNMQTNEVVWTTQLYRIYGREPGTPPPLEDEFLNQFHPDDRQKLLEAIDRSARTGRYDIECRLYRHNDGELRYIRGIGEVQFDENGQPYKHIGTAADVTEQREAKRALAESEERHRVLLDHAGVGIGYYDLDGNCLLMNKLACNHLNRTLEELIGRNVQVLFPGYADMILKRIEESTKSDRPITHEDEIMLSGRTRYFLSTYAPITDGSQQTVGVMIVSQDVTEDRRLRELESRAERLELAGSIAGQVAHDFNNLLAPMLAYGEFIREDLPPESEAVKLVGDIERAAAKIAEINQDLLTMGRRGHYNQEVIKLNDVIQQVVSDQTDCPHPIDQKLDLASDLLFVRGGPAQLHRAISNLVTNACDAMPDGGELLLRTENFYVDDDSLGYSEIPRGEYVKLTVSDTGCGMPDDILARIFDPFFTTKSADRERGSGLGMSVVDAVIKDHGGFIDVDTAPGKGTSFYIYLPITREQPEASQPDEPRGGDESILVVDDDRIQREVTDKLLQSLGYRVAVVDSGSAAVEYLQDNQCDLVILDMVMPEGMDGADTFEEIRNLRPHQKAIIASGFSETDRVQRALDLGAGAFVKKPLTRNMLANAVREELDRILEAHANS